MKTIPGGNRRRYIVTGMLMWMACGFPALAMSPPAGGHSGSIDITEARLLQTQADWLLEATADIQLSPEIRAGLDSGVPLQFIVELTVREPRRWWLDRTRLSYRSRYSLIYYELTRHYRVKAEGSEISHNFRSLLAALDELGRLRGVAIPATVEQEQDTPLTGHLRIRLDSRALPLPLQPMLSKAWRLSSEEYIWPIN